MTNNTTVDTNIALAVDVDMVRDLFDSAARADQTGVVLTADGWDVHVAPGGLPRRYTAMTGEDVAAYHGGDEEFDPELGRILADGDPHTSYVVPVEDDDFYAGAHWQVAFDDEQDGDWSTAWAFDLDAATLLIGEATGPRGLRETGTSSQLWITAGGRYLAHLYRTSGEIHLEQWVELDRNAACAYAYRVRFGDQPHGHAGDPDRLVCDDAGLPPLIRAAWLAGELAETLAAPTIRDDSDPLVRRARAWKHRDEAAESFHGNRAAAQLLRNTVLGDLREQRARAAAVVADGFDRDHFAAADHLGVSPTTLDHLF